MHYDYAAKALMFLSEFAPIRVNDWTHIKLGSNMQHNSSYSLFKSIRVDQILGNRGAQLDACIDMSTPDPIDVDA